MPRLSNADLLARYRSRVEATKRFRRDESYDDTWKRLIDLYRGKQYEYMTEDDRMTVNVAFATVNVIAPSVAVNNPKITVNANKSEAMAQAIITEAVVNYWWRHFRIKQEFRRAVKDFLVVGHGWLKCGYRYVEEEQVLADPNDLDAPIYADIDSDSGQPADDSTPTVIVTEDRPFVERVSPFDVFVDPDATSMYDAGWIAQRVRRTLTEVRNDKRYNSSARDDATPSTWGRLSGDESYKQEVKDEGEKYVEVWEFYDLKKRTISVFTDGGDKFLVAPKAMPYKFGHPFTMIRNYDVPDQFYPLGDLEAIEPLQRELNETRSQMMNHRKRFARKYLFRADAFDSQNRSLLQSDDDNVMIPISGDEPLDSLITAIKQEQTPPEFYDQSGMITNDIEYVSGVSEYMRGSMPEIRRTATEAAIVQDASNARASDKLAIIEGAIAEVASRLVQLAQQFMNSEQVARVTGKDGQPVWVTFDADYIAGEFDYEVEAGSTAPANESFRRQSALQMVDALAPFIQMGVVNMPKLAARVLQDGFGIKNPDQYLVMPVMPDGQQPPPVEGQPPGQTGAQGAGMDPQALGALAMQGAPTGEEPQE